MDHASALWGALRDALSLSGLGAVFILIAALSKSRSDQRMMTKQLEQKIAADERDDSRDDRKVAAERLDRSYEALERLLATTERQRDFAFTELEKSRSEIADKQIRDEALAARHVTFEQAFVLVDEALAARHKMTGEHAPPLD